MKKLKYYASYAETTAQNLINFKQHPVTSRLLSPLNFVLFNYFKHMETLKFKTNIQCGGCIATVTPHMDKLCGIGNWDVDTIHAEKKLTIRADHLLASEVIAALKAAGYRAEQI